MRIWNHVNRCVELIDAFLAWAASEAELQKTRFDTMLRLTELARAAGRLIGERHGESQR